MPNTVLLELNRRSTSSPTPTTTLTPNPNSTPTPTPTSTPPLFPFQTLDAYRFARELAVRVHSARIADPELRDQATRAAKSAFLNLCEGLPDDRAAMRRKYFLASDGSLHEVVGAVDLACAIGAVGTDAAAEIQALAVRLRAMLRGLLRGARSV
ncbi:four helix bundle protein [Anaeromyxobacter terrae]|uniref:four helix bundle protein n=1 Tax=Anaeromyxobacter terrae TaxID=2925406 RepID=UPI001F56EED4|nr:four helix bundle protein [Anaeromyxobacter sp. SG22]